VYGDVAGLMTVVPDEPATPCIPIIAMIDAGFPPPVHDITADVAPTLENVTELKAARYRVLTYDVVVDAPTTPCAFNDVTVNE